MLTHRFLLQLLARCQRAIHKTHEHIVAKKCCLEESTSVLLAEADLGLRGGFVSRVRRGLERDDMLDVRFALELLEAERHRECVGVNCNCIGAALLLEAGRAHRSGDEGSKRAPDCHVRVLRNVNGVLLLQSQSFFC
jgi:hypothetical protein